MPYYASRQSYTFSNLRRAGIGFLIMAGLGAVGKQTIAAGLILMEAIGLGKQVNNIRKMSPEQRQDVPKGLLAARIVGWGTLGATFIGGALAVANGALSPLVVAAWFLGNAVGLGTLVTEKVVRGFKRRANNREIINQTTTPKQYKEVVETMEGMNLSESQMWSIREPIEVNLEGLKAQANQVELRLVTAEEQG